VGAAARVPQAGARAAARTAPAHQSQHVPGQPWRAPMREGRLMPMRPATFIAMWVSAYRDWKAVSMRPWMPYRRNASHISGRWTQS